MKKKKRKKEKKKTQFFGNAKIKMKKHCARCMFAPIKGNKQILMLKKVALERKKIIVIAHFIILTSQQFKKMYYVKQ